MNRDWRTRKLGWWSRNWEDVAAIFFVFFWAILCFAWVGLWVWVIIELVGWITSH